MKRVFLMALVLVMALAVFHESAEAQQTTTGSIEGTVMTPEGTPVAGATVTVSATQGSKSAVTDAGGRYRIAYLTPGNYSLSATGPGYSTVQRQNVEVPLGATARVEIILNPGVTEDITVMAEAPAIDLNTATSGANITSELMENVPMGRTIAGALPMAPNVVASGIDASNPSISGASGLENTYVIDGVNVNNTGFGSLGSYSIVLGSLGTGVNFDYVQEIQVKTGGYEPEYGEALGGFVNLITKSGGNELKGSLLGYYQSSDLEATRVRTDRVDATYDPTGYESRDFGFEIGGPIVKDKAFWYGAFNPTFQKRLRRTAQAITDAQGFRHDVEVDRTIYNYAANIKWFLSPNHTLAVSAFGDPATGDMGPQRVDAVAVENPETRFSEIRFGGHNAVVRWDAQLMPSWLAEASVAYHRDRFEEDPNVNLPQGVDRSGESPVRRGGLGFYSNSKSQNTQYQLKFSNFFRGGGEHNLRYGVQFQKMGYDNTTLYSGAPGLELPDSSIATTGFSWDINADGNFRINRIRSGNPSAETNADYLALFAYDTWNPAKNLHIMAGIRYEEEKLIGNLSEVKFDGNWAPRVNVTWDPTNDNKTKIAAAYGRFFGKVPNDLAVRALSSEVTYVINYPDESVDLSDPNNPVITGPAEDYFTFGSVPTVIDPDAKLTYQDEYLVSVDRQVARSMTLGVTYLHRQLGRTLEDVQLVPYSDILAGEADFGEYIITNPTEEQGFPKPERRYDAVTFRADKRLSHNWQLLGSYTWSKLEGNYEGYYRRDNGQSDPFITSLYDFPYLADPNVWRYTSESGVLPNDRTHVFNLFGSHQFDFGMTLGMSLKVQSGVPITKLGHNIVYGSDDEILLEPRGASGRGPTTTDLGLHLDYGFDIGQGRKVELIANVFNVLNHQKGIDFIPTYELGGTVDPPEGLEDIIEACPECVNPDFAKPFEYQPPRQIMVALRTTF